VSDPLGSDTKPDTNQTRRLPPVKGFSPTVKGVLIGFLNKEQDLVDLLVHWDAWQSEVDTASTWTHRFLKADLGKRLYVAMRWENPSSGGKTDGKGPWSAVQSVISA
jgi:hypothetical protein